MRPFIGIGVLFVAGGIVATQGPVAFLGAVVAALAGLILGSIGRSKN